MMSTKSSDEVNTHPREDLNWERPKSVTTISFDQKKGHYSIDSGLNSHYWFKMSDERAAGDSLSPESSDEEAMEAHGMDDWCSDDDEVVPIYPEAGMVPLMTADNWNDIYSNSVSDIVTTDDIRLTCDSTADQQTTTTEDNREGCPPLSTVVLPYTGISRNIKGMGVGLHICGGFSSHQGLAAVITEVDYTGPGFIIGNLTAGYIVLKWNGVSLLNKTFEQTRDILSQKIMSNELNLIVCNSSGTTVVLPNIKEELDQDVEEAIPRPAKQSHRQSVISWSGQQEWVFEENVLEEERHSLLESELLIEQTCGFIQLSLLHSQSQLEVTLHQTKLSDNELINPLASITLIGEGLSNSDELFVSQLSQLTVNPAWNQKFEPLRLPQKLVKFPIL